jgi:phospholipase A-2-activating protein
VVSGEGSGSSKKVYEGKEYDYVFDIDIEDGKPPLKLPYNLTENAWDAARKFLERNELPLSYYEQVANWLTENTRGAKFGRDTAPSQQAPSQGHDAWGTEKRYRPGDAGPTSSGSLPQRKYLDIIEGNPLNAINLICKKTDELKSSGDITAEQSLQSDDVQALQALSTQLQNKTDPKPTAAQTSPLFKVATQWPTKSRVPAVGVLALCAVSPDFVNTASNGTVIETLSSANLFAPRQETANNVVHAIRLLVNLFKSDPGRHVIAKSFDNILSLVRPYATEPESPAQAKALATLYVNLAVLLISDSKPSNATTKAKALLTDIAVLLECENPHAAADAEILSRALIALGTLLFLSDEFRRELKPGVAGSLHFVATKPLAKSSEMVQRVLQELRDLLR